MTTAPATTTVTAQELDRIEFDATWDLWNAVPPDARQRSGLFCATVGRLRVVGSRLTPNTAMLNRILGAGVADIADGSLERAVALLHDAGCICQIPVRDDTPDGSALRQWLDARGFEEGYAWMKFVHDGAPPPDPEHPPQVTVRLAGTADGRCVGEILVEAFDLPAELAVVGNALVTADRWATYVAESRDGVPVGIGAMYLQAGSAYLGLGGTVTGARGLGAQGAVLGTRVAAAQRRGASVIATETGEQVPDRPSRSYRNIRRAGFVEHGLRSHAVLTI